MQKGKDIITLKKPDLTISHALEVFVISLEDLQKMISFLLITGLEKYFGQVQEEQKQVLSLEDLERNNL